MESVEAAAALKADIVAAAATFLYDQGARTVWLFGSLARQSGMDRLTDIDLAVEGLDAAAIDRITTELRARHRCRLHVVSFEHAPPALRHGIMASRVLLLRTAHRTARPVVRLSEDRSHLVASLHRQRFDAVVAELDRHKVQSVVDLGCGTGALLIELARSPRIGRLVGIDVDAAVLRSAREACTRALSGLERLKMDLVLGLATNPDPRLVGVDAIVLVEAIEHFSPSQLPALAQTVFGFARPKVVVITTPNREYNSAWKGLGDGRLRLREHRFEWTRAEGDAWAAAQAAHYGYDYRNQPVGPPLPAIGSPTQMLTFVRDDELRARASPNVRATLQ